MGERSPWRIHLQHGVTPWNGQDSTVGSTKQEQRCRQAWVCEAAAFLNSDFVRQE